MPGRSSKAADFDRGRFEGLLSDLPDVELVGLLAGSSNYTFLARLGPHPPEGLLAVYKPARGESPLWDFAAGTLYKREIVAYELSKVLGWPRIPPTVARRRGPHGPGAMQLFIESDNRHFLSEQSLHTETWVRIAVFDVIVNNADRKSGHCLFDASERIWVIDHGLTFHTDPKLRTVIWDFAGQPLPQDLCPDLERSLASLDGGELGRVVEPLLSPAELDVLRRRLRAVLAPNWRFPEPTSAWSIPWPPV